MEEWPTLSETTIIYLQKDYKPPTFAEPQQNNTGADPRGGGRKIVIFHTKYPKNFRAFLHSAQFF
jgi:hypothetical protein